MSLGKISSVQALSRLAIILVIYIWGRLIWYVTTSFTWPMDGDLSFIYYITWLMNDHDFVPYRDIHETSFFGTFIFYSLLTKLIGYSTTAFHFTNLIFFSALSTITYFLLRPFGKVCAFFAIGLFGGFYFSKGIGVLMQRDFIALLPTALALLISQQPTIKNTTKAFLVGALFATSSCIKPQFAAGASLTIFLIWIQSHPILIKSIQPLLKYILFSFIGFSLVWALGFIWLAYHKNTAQFMDMIFNYLPAYNSMNGRNFARNNADAWLGAGRWLKGTFLTWLPLIGMSIWFGFRNYMKSGKFIFFLILIWILYLSYVPMAGKYWDYHQTPSFYFLSILIAFVFCKPKKEFLFNKLQLLLPVFWSFLFFVLVLQGSLIPHAQVNNDMNKRLAISTTELIDYLKSTYKAGDKVQPNTSHTRGPIFPALLALKILPATPYLENYLLFHDIQSGFVKQARENYLKQLSDSPPRFIIETPPSFYFNGENTDYEFNAFKDWIDKNYSISATSSKLPMQSITETFTVYELNH